MEIQTRTVGGLESHKIHSGSEPVHTIIKASNRQMCHCCK